MNQKTCNFIVHCGGQLSTRNEIASVPTPRAEASFCPIPHSRLLELVEGSCLQGGLEVIHEAHALARDGQEYFGLLQIGRRDKPVELVTTEQVYSGYTYAPVAKDYAYVVGLRNAHNKRFPASLVVGQQVFICDNLSFSSEIAVSRKHTTFIERDLPLLTSAAVGKLSGAFAHADDRFAAYKNHTITKGESNDLVIRLAEVGAITALQILPIVHEFTQPRHEEFRDGLTLWRLYNAVTEVQKDKPSLWKLPKRGYALDSVLDSVCDISWN